MNSNRQNYYGPFFWIAAVSFVVPVFVAWSAFDRVRPSTKPTPNPDVSGVDHMLWDYLLRTYVEGGLVDYEGLSRDYLFTTYIQQIAACDPEKLASRDSKLALHCNAYNALVINGVINHKIHLNEKNVLEFLPSTVAAKVEELEKQLANDEGQEEVIREEIRRLKADSQFFRLKEHIFANETISLDELEQARIRPVFGEPRIHVALVCAAKSCPAIRPEAYTGERLEQQLKDQSKLFAEDPRYVAFDETEQRVRLSPILSWYAEDWKDVGGYLVWLSELVDDTSLKGRLQQAAANEVAVDFNTYDWTLNSQSSSLHSASGKGSGFGSGSVPNE